MPSTINIPRDILYSKDATLLAKWLSTQKANIPEKVKTLLYWQNNFNVLLSQAQIDLALSDDS